jgi:RNA polymerase sigma factor (sigma-70 family)
MGLSRTSGDADRARPPCTIGLSLSGGPLRALPPMPTDDFADVLALHRPELHRHCCRMLRSPADAEDALQEALLNAWRARRTLSSRSPRGWLFRIATNACVDVARRRAETAPLDDAFSAPAEQGPETIVLERETVELAVLTALRELPPRQHASFVLRDVLSCSGEESAGALSLSVAASNSALQRARSRLRAQLAPDRLQWASAPASRAERRFAAALSRAR